MLRLRSNCTVIEVTPSELDEVIESTPEMFDSDRSSGVATELAIVSASAPGSDAEIWIVGKSTCGSGATGRDPNATTPTSTRPSISSEVAIGRTIKGREMFISCRTPLRVRGPHVRSDHARPAGSLVPCTIVDNAAVVPAQSCAQG